MAQMDKALREKILAHPGIIIDDQDVMTALIEAYDTSMGRNVVDMRSLAMRQLEERIERIEETHRVVVAAAYDNMASTSQIHRGVLRLMEAATLEQFLDALTGDVAAILRLDAVRLILETEDTNLLSRPQDDGLTMAERGVVAAYVSGRIDHPLRQVTLRQMDHGVPEVYGVKGEVLRSEACLLLEFGPSHPHGLLVMGSENPCQFTPQHGTDLLAFFAHATELCLSRLMA